VTTPENPARWATDPLGRHQYRYWDGGQWTEHVSDDGMVTADPPVASIAPVGDPAFSAPPVPGTGAATWNQVPTTTYDPTAVLGRRYGAFAIDAVICLVVFLGLFFASASTHTPAEVLRDPACHRSATDSSQIECDNDRAVITVNDTVYEAELGLFIGLCVLFTFLYFAVVEGFSGGSAGKHMIGLRVVTPDGARPGLPRSLARWAIFAVDGPFSFFLCGIFTSSMSTGHRRLGDMAATTYVVGRADAGRPVVLPTP
jgi:uncharacterized RDD family membrane protein YckC